VCAAAATKTNITHHTKGKPRQTLSSNFEEVIHSTAGSQYCSSVDHGSQYCICTGAIERNSDKSHGGDKIRASDSQQISTDIQQTATVAKKLPESGLK
jgi:hypothetical protein